MHRRFSSILASTVAAALFGLFAPAEAANPQTARYASDNEGIFWFVHISDTHVESVDSRSDSRFEQILDQYVPVINPIAVFVTGDLVDGFYTLSQIKGEWENYGRILDDTQSSDPDWFFDSPGNHDAYSDRGLGWYLDKSLQGKTTGTALFAETVHCTKFGKYYFIATNSAGTFSHPLTYGNPQFTDIEKMKAGLEANSDAQLVFVFAHHHLVPHGDVAVARRFLGLVGMPDDPPGNSAEVLDQLDKHSAFYLHGHVHQYKEYKQAGVVSIQIASAVEDEAVCEDKKCHLPKHLANIGIGIVDHNAFVYGGTDSLNPWPFVAITAPVDMYLKGGGRPKHSWSSKLYPGDMLAYGAEKNPYAYDVCLDSKDNPVRALVLNDGDISSVTVIIDGIKYGDLKPVEPTNTDEQAGIYATTMNTKNLTPGEHKLTVAVKSGDKYREDTITVNFIPGPCEPFVGIPTHPEALEDGGASCGLADVEDDTPDAGGSGGSGPCCFHDGFNCGPKAGAGSSGGIGAFVLLFGIVAFAASRRRD
ncbi:MAG: metallophosphoesterase [Polyangiaceae bacterium]|nr:metallophosphoesterase [Polyangiaceae bacterium]